MISMDQCIIDLYQRGEITEETALMSSINPDQVKRKMGR